MEDDAGIIRVARHPVVELLHERAASGSQAGARRDPYRLAVVLEGGGMRGVVSAGMTAALERLGFTDCFDLVVGSSAGAINGAALLAGVAQGGAAAYHGMMASRSFVNPWALLRGRPVIDVEHVLESASAELDVARHERVIESPIEFHSVAVSVRTAAAVTFTGMRSREDLVRALVASSRMPWAGGAPVEIGDDRYLDGGLASPIPLHEALQAGATHVLALQTRPYGVPRRSASRIGDRLIERHLSGLNPELVTLYRGRIAAYEDLVEDIARRTCDTGSVTPPHVLGVRPPAGAPVVSQLERRGHVLATAARAAEELLEQALGSQSARPAAAI
jgi:predicted patatin/cPLA2 family phospholipase